VSDFVLDASVALQWFLEDEANRGYSLKILGSLVDKNAVVPTLWFYEVVNGLLMAQRRKRIAETQVVGFLSRIQKLPIKRVEQTLDQILELPILARQTNLTCYDAAYLALAMSLSLPLATADSDLLKAAVLNSVPIVVD
jgi:predicted nucleic acid-binding protein